MASRLATAFLRRHHHHHHFTRSAASLLSKPIQISSPLSPISNHFLRSFSTRPKKLSIGERTRQKQTRRFWLVTGTLSAIASFSVMIIQKFQDQLVFYVTPTDLLQKYTSDPSQSKFRLGGLVLENSIMDVPTSAEVQFVVTDLITDILVKYEGSLPDLFREGHSVVVEGFVKPVDEEVKRTEEELLKSSSKFGATKKARQLECYFSGTEVLAKHDEKYMPKEVATAIAKNRKILAEEGEEEKSCPDVVNASAAVKA